jgi:hypothetical protein
MENIDPEKFCFMMCVHFPKVKPGQVEDLRCEICEDLKNKHCQGKSLKGQAVILCMIEKAEFSEFHLIGSASSMH